MSYDFTKQRGYELLGNKQSWLKSIIIRTQKPYTFNIPKLWKAYETIFSWILTLSTAKKSEGNQILSTCSVKKERKVLNSCQSEPIIFEWNNQFLLRYFSIQSKG